MNKNVSKYFMDSSIGRMKFNASDEGKFYSLNRTFGGGKLTDRFPFGGKKAVGFVFVVGPDLKLWQVPPSAFDTLEKFRNIHQ